MGIYDRAYYQGDEPHLGHGSEPSMATKLVIANVVVYLANMLFGRGNLLTYSLAITPETLREPWMWWQLLTYGFAHSPQDVRHIFWNMFTLWMFGREVEAVYGRKEFLRFYLVSVVVCGLAWTARNLAFPSAGIALGASGATTAIIMLFVFLFPKRTLLLMFIFPVPAWVLGVIIIAINTFGMSSVEVGNRGTAIAYDIHLAGAAFGAAYFWFHWNFGRWLPAGFSWPTRWFRRRPSLKVHQPDASRENIDAAGDRVLEKLHREGEAKLSKEERRILEEYSRRMRQKHQ